MDDLKELEKGPYKYLRILKPKDGRVKRTFFVFELQPWMRN